MQFLNVNDAIRVLRKGTKDDQWFDAASYLIERASPEVKLMLEVGRELEKQEHVERSTYSITRWLLVVVGGVVMVSSAGYVGWLIMGSLGVVCGA